MSGYHREADALRAHIRSLRLAMACLLVVALAFAWGWYTAPRHLRVHIPPDLRSAVDQNVNTVPPPNVYAFAHYLWTQIHAWPKDGAEDSRRNLYRYAAYLTPACREQLGQEYARRANAGELTGRTRAMTLAPDGAYEDHRVDVTAPGNWVVWLDEQIEESVGGMSVKAITVRYPLRVRRVNVDMDQNPWGLAIDCYAAAPTLLGDAAPKAPGARR